MSKVMIVLIALMGTMLYLGLAVLGWGGFAAFFAHPALSALTIATFLLLVVGMMSSGNLSRGEREDRNNRWVLWAFGVVAVLDGYVPAYTDRIGFWTIDGDGIRWLGVVFFAAGGVLRLWPVFVLGRRFSGLVAIQPGHTLVIDGIFGTVRNPSYLGMLVMVLGWGLAFRSGVGVLLAASMILPLLARIHAEENMLHSQFGAAYDTYRARTWRLVPWLY